MLSPINCYSNYKSIYINNHANRAEKNISYTGLTQNTEIKTINPEVKLISDTSHILDTLYVAAKNCVISDKPYEIYENLENISQEEKLRVIRNAVNSGHTSILEHAMVTFAVSDISRVCAQMLKSYRQSSTTQKSQRHIADKKQFEYIMPNSINKNDIFARKYENLMKNISDLYLEFVEGGIPPEDARYMYPLAITTSTVTSFNLRELVLVENERLCSRAQEEIRVLADNIRQELITKEPWLEEFLVPKCERLGYCQEYKSCGQIPKRQNFNLLNKK